MPIAAGPLYALTMARGDRQKGDRQVEPLRGFLLARGWASRVTTYDRYGGVPMDVELSPAPSPEQLDALHKEFGDQYRFDSFRAFFHRG